MNVVLTEKVLAMAADEVTPEGDRIPLTNFHSWNIGVDEDEEGNMCVYQTIISFTFSIKHSDNFFCLISAD